MVRDSGNGFPGANQISRRRRALETKRGRGLVLMRAFWTR